MDQATIARFSIPASCSSVRTSRAETPALEVVGEETDEVLLQALGRGSREALSVLFRRHATQVWSIGRRILRDPGEAEDLVQDVFLYVLGEANLYDDERGSARSWLIQVAYTQAFQRRRKLRYHGFYDLGHRESPPQWAEPTEDKYAAYDDTVEALFGRNGWRKILRSLTEEQRETLRLYFFEGCTFAEIAERLGQSYANVRNHHYRALEKVRKHLAGSVVNGVTRSVSSCGCMQQGTACVSTLVKRATRS